MLAMPPWRVGNRKLVPIGVAGVGRGALQPSIGVTLRDGEELHQGDEQTLQILFLPA
jgi:hypothetical protein